MAFSRESLRQRAKNLSEDVAEVRQEVSSLKEGVNNIVTGINQSLGTHPRRLALMEEMMQAVTQLAGISNDQLLSKIKETRMASAKENHATNQAALAKAVETGDMEVCSSVEPVSLVCGTEADPTGKPIESDGEGNAIFEGKVEFEVAKAKPEVQNLLLGKNVGDVVTFPNGGTFKVEAVYKANPERVQSAVQRAMENANQSEAPQESQG